MFGLDILLGGALTGGSMLANIFADEERRRQREEALRDDAMNNFWYNLESDRLNTQARGRYKDFGGQQAKQAQGLGQYFSQARPIAGSSTGSQSKIMAGERGAQMGRAASYSNQQGGALGNLRAFDQTLGGINRGVMRDAGYLNQNLGFQKAMANLTPARLAAANNSSSAAGLGMGADLMKGFGGIALSNGIQGGAPFSSSFAAGGGGSGLAGLFSGFGGLF